MKKTTEENLFKWSIIIASICFSIAGPPSILEWLSGYLIAWAYPVWTFDEAIQWRRKCVKENDRRK